MLMMVSRKYSKPVEFTFLFSTFVYYNDHCIVTGSKPRERTMMVLCDHDGITCLPLIWTFEIENLKLR